MSKSKTKKSKQPETASFVDKYKGQKTFGIWNVDEDGDKVGDYPLVAFGLKKAKAILDHLDELQEYVEAEEARQSSESEDDEPKPKKKVKPLKRKRSNDSDEDE